MPGMGPMTTGQDQNGVMVTSGVMMNAGSATLNSGTDNAVTAASTAGLNANSNLDLSAQICQPMQASEERQQNRTAPGRPVSHGPMGVQDYEVTLDQNYIADQRWVREELQCENEDWCHENDDWRHD